MHIISDTASVVLANADSMAEKASDTVQKINQAAQEQTSINRRVSKSSTAKDVHTLPESPSQPSDRTSTQEHSQSDVATTAAGRFKLIMTGERKWSVSIASLVGAIPALLLGITLGYPSNALLDLTGEATELQPEYFFSDLMISLFVVSSYNYYYKVVYISV